MALLPARGRVVYKGVTVNRRTRAALKWAEKRAGISPPLSQGSYRPRTPYSGSTHMGGGAVDISIRSLTDDQRIAFVHALKDAGFAAWWRRPGWDGKNGAEHIHAVLIDDPELSAGAAWQTVGYDAKRDGLTGNKPDNTYRPKPAVRWNYTLGRPVQRKPRK